MGILIASIVLFVVIIGVVVLVDMLGVTEKDGSGGDKAANARGARPGRRPSLVQRIKRGLISPESERRQSSILKMGLLSDEKEWSTAELARILRDIGGNPEERALAAQSLAQRAEATPDVVAACHAGLHDKNQAVVLSTLRLVRRLGREAAELLPQLERHQRSENENIRREAVLAIGEMGEARTQTLTSLWDVAEDAASNDLPTRLKAAHALLDGGSSDRATTRRLLPTLQLAMTESSAAEREKVVEVMSVLGSADPEALSECLKHDASAVRVGAARALRRLDDGALPVIAEAGRHSDPAVRAEALIAYGEVLPAEPGSLATVFPFLSDGNNNVRQTAIRVVSRWGTQMIPGLLAELASRGGQYARRPVYSAIEAMGRDAMKELRPLYNQGDATQRREVVQTLAAVQTLGDEGRELLERATKDPDESIRSEAELAYRALK